MANEEHIKWLREGVKSWNERRRKHPFRPDLSGVYIPSELQGSSYKEKSPFFFSLKGIDLSYADFCNAGLFGLDLRDANLGAIDLRDAELIGTDFGKANLSGAKLDGVVAHEAQFTGANLIWVLGCWALNLSMLTSLAPILRGQRSGVLTLGKQP